MIGIEKIKEYIKCPQFGDLEYGKWGALRLEQRVAYKELIEEIERLNNIINELEKFICDLEIECNIDNSMWGVAVIIHNKLKELKGDSSNE